MVVLNCCPVQPDPSIYLIKKSGPREVQSSDLFSQLKRRKIKKKLTVSKYFIDVKGLENKSKLRKYCAEPLYRPKIGLHF